MQEDRSPKKALLGELESIIDILDDNEKINDDFFEVDKPSEQRIKIPLLDDVVNNEEPNHSQEAEEEDANLFDLERIFSEESLLTAPSTENITTEEISLEATTPEAAIMSAPLLTTPISETDAKSENSEEDQSEMFPVSEPPFLAQPIPPSDPADTTVQSTAPSTVNGRQHNLHQDLDLIIQELVDEFVPVLESRLREQLSELPPGIIQELAEKHLNQ
ncbi:MAG: hypothetical protein ACJA0N_002610 [Pseudohongiellaceae bacterium]|jgi:hypothetical protein